MNMKELKNKITKKRLREIINESVEDTLNRIGIINEIVIRQTGALYSLLPFRAQYERLPSRRRTHHEVHLFTKDANPDTDSDNLASHIHPFAGDFCGTC